MLEGNWESIPPITNEKTASTERFGPRQILKLAYNRAGERRHGSFFLREGTVRQLESDADCKAPQCWVLY